METENPQTTLVLGGGPAGLTAGYLLGKAGRHAIVLEADDQVGGLAKTVEIDGYRFDLGGHRFFTKVRAVDDLWWEILGSENFLSRPRQSRIFYRGKLYDYPLKATNALRNLGFEPPPARRFVHEELGWNFRMTNLQAAVGLAQLERIDEFIARKRHAFARYMELLGGVDGIQLPVTCTDFADNINWVFGVVLADSVPFDAEVAMKKLADLGIGTRPFFWPMHEQPVYAQAGLFAGERHPNAERIARRGFYLPSGLALTDEQMIRVAETVRRILA